MIEWCSEKWLFNQLSSEQTIAKFSILYDISLVRDWKRKSWLITPGSERVKQRGAPPSSSLWETSEFSHRKHFLSFVFWQTKDYRKDGFLWKKRKCGNTAREDHFKLKVDKIEVRLGGQWLLSLTGKVLPVCASSTTLWMLSTSLSFTSKEVSLSLKDDFSQVMGFIWLFGTIPTW